MLHYGKNFDFIFTIYFSENKKGGNVHIMKHEFSLEKKLTLHIV